MSSSLPMIPRTHECPHDKDWHLRFVGNIDDLIDMEDKLRLELGILQPIVFDRGKVDELDIWLEWNQELAETLLDIMIPNVNLETNERTGKQTTCQNMT